MEKLDYYPAPVLHEEDPQVQALMAASGLRFNEARGALDRVFQWLNLYGNMSNKTGKKPHEIAQIAGRRNFARAMIQARMAELDENGNMLILLIPHRIGLAARKREADAERQRKHRKRHSDSHGDSLKEGEREGEREGYIKGGGDNNTTNEGEPPPQDDGAFQAWVKPLMMAHPALKECASLPRHVAAAAREAFRCYPRAAEHAELLAAYYLDRLQEDRNGKPFWRPDGAEKYFREIGDVIRNAERWRKEKGKGWNGSRRKDCNDPSRYRRND